MVRRSVRTKLAALAGVIVFTIFVTVAYTLPSRATAQENALTSPSQVALLMPIMNSANGRALFAGKGCVVCHSVNGVGGTDAPSLDVSNREGPMNPFDFAASMWRGAPAMIAMQNAEMGGQIQLTGQELADIIAFAHDPAEQAKFSESDIPEDIEEIMGDGH